MELKKLLQTTLLLLTLAIYLPACAQEKDSIIEKEPKENTGEDAAEETAKSETPPHRYGGWYCPDNFGFTPMDVQEVKNLPVIADRLPTEEETNSSKSLILVDTEKYPDARPLDIGLPRLGRVYTQHSGIHELVVIIQALVIGEDTIVGYRFINGGNGSDWLNQVELLDKEEVEAMGSQPFVYEKVVVKGNTQDVWSAFTTTTYAKQLGTKFNENIFYNAVWTNESNAHLDYQEEKKRGKGILMNMYGNLYMHIDYELDGFHYSEKMLVGENKEEGTTEIHFAAGPFPEDHEKEVDKWRALSAEIKLKSEQ